MSDPLDLTDRRKLEALLADRKQGKPPPVENVEEGRLHVAQGVAVHLTDCARAFGLELIEVDANLIEEASLNGDFDVGARERLEEMFGEAFRAAKEAGAKRIRLTMDEDGDLRIDPA